MSVAYAYHARSGLARSGLARAGYFTPNVIVLINGVDRTTAVQRESLSITLARNDEPSSARFRLVAHAGVLATGGQTVTISLGSSEFPLFGGQVIDHEHVFENDGESTPWITVTCGDWTALFNRRLVTYDYTGWNADDAANHLIETYTTGFTSRVKPDLDLLEEFICINEPPMSVLRRIATSIGGGCRIDGAKNVRLWDADGEEGHYAPTAPDTLVSGLWSLQSFVHGYDFSQVRTRVIGEGGSSTVPVAIPAGSMIDLYGLPVSYQGGLNFNPAPHAHLNYFRIGTQIYEYDYGVFVSGPPAVQVTADVTAGASTISVTTVVPFTDYGSGGIVTGWLHDGRGNYFAFTADGLFPTTITVLETTGYASLKVDLAAADALYMSHHLFFKNATPVTLDIAEGDSITVRMVEDDAAAQALIAAIEGGDGIHEHIISDGNWTWVGASWAAREELNQFAASLPRVSWTTRDMNALPGARQAANITLTGGIVDTVNVESVSITFPVEAGNNHALPLRQCEGNSVKLQGILEMIQARGF